ncbi:Peptidase S41 family ustP [Hyphodiscus hymeniophilus]|uniref:Peptidase S41 family ustP n=1 Tax=Hyphodiscus hymeniophilus TaxID=353542 RepID=A0A9P7AYN2_9HELO|nr:Peptidase S41 family ustP [Hyphodiscus hymeniophilus]
MRWQFLAASFLVRDVLSASLPNTPTTNTTEPCGLITSQALEFLNGNLSTSNFFYFDARLGISCLESSTINSDLAVSFIAELSKYVEFQSTLSYLKDPPSDYQYPPVDILGGLSDISTKAAAGGFSGQYAFDQALAQLLTSAHDGHFASRLCTAISVFFARPVDFISLSVDGVQLPLVYTLEDADAMTDNFTVSNIVAINGQNVTAVIESEALFVVSDPDAAYNSMFWSTATAPINGNFTGGLTLPQVNFNLGPYTNLTFANGTHKSYLNQAFIVPNRWSENIVDGESFTNELCVGPAQSTAASGAVPTSSATVTPNPTSAVPSTTASTVPNQPTILGHPETPVVKDLNNAVAGYFLNGTEYNDTAVLFVASFESQGDGNPADFAATFSNATQDFFAAVKAANKTKLVIDLSGNLGGNTLLPNDLFRRLFPTIEPYGGARYRIPTAANIFGQSFGALPQASVDPLSTDNATAAALKLGFEIAPWNYRSSLTTDLKNLTGWSEFFPPNVVNGDNFTVNVRAPTNNTYFDESTDAIVPFRPADQQEDLQPFSVENIVILTDGTCASACTIFAEFMTRQAGVKTILVGGRPRNAPAQAIGGTKGSEVYSLAQLADISQSLLILGLVPDSLLDLANETFPGLVNLPLGSPSDLDSYTLNLRDNIPVGDDSQTPLQFVFEPADCRIFYTADTASQPHKLWEYAADVAWKGKKCAWGGVKTPPVSSSNGTGSGSSGQQQITTNDASRGSNAFPTVMASIVFAIITQVV